MQNITEYFCGLIDSLDHKRTLIKCILCLGGIGWDIKSVHIQLLRRLQNKKKHVIVYNNTHVLMLAWIASKFLRTTCGLFARDRRGPHRGICIVLWMQWFPQADHRPEAMICSITICCLLSLFITQIFNRCIKYVWNMDSALAEWCRLEILHRVGLVHRLYVHSEAGSPVSVHTDDSTVTYFKITGMAQNCPPNFMLQ